MKLSDTKNSNKKPSYYKGIKIQSDEEVCNSDKENNKSNSESDHFDSDQEYFN